MAVILYFLRLYSAGGGTETAYRVLEKALSSGTERSRESIMQTVTTLRDERATPLFVYILRHVDHRLQVGRKAVLQQHLTVGHVDVGEVVGRGACLVQQTDDLECVVDETWPGVGRPDRQVDRVTDLLVEFAGDGRPEHDFALRFGVFGAALGVADLEIAPRALGRVARGDGVGYAKAE